MAVAAWRDRAWEELASREFDVLVVGGGIVGAGLAHEAARAGLAVALVDRADFGSQTTSASSKLIHGGLRYLRLGDVRLVREAHQERRALTRVVAPHLVRRLPFLLPLYRDGPYRPFTIRTGLYLYSALAGERMGRALTPEAAQRRVPPLRVDGLSACGVYADAVTHDARLCLANVRAAADAGATVLNYAEAVAVRIAGGRARGAEIADTLGRETAIVRARTIVNATGPWVDRVRLLEDPAARPSVRLSAGVHVLVPLETPWSAALVVPHDSARVSFAIPWEGMLLLGTTERAYEAHPDELRPTEREIEAVLAEASVALDSSPLTRQAVLSAFAGLRVLPRRGGDTARTRRETIFLRGPAGMLSIAGGKLTTYRRIALQALRALGSDLGVTGGDREPVTLPGAADPAVVAERLVRGHPALDAELGAHLARVYGSFAADVVACADGDDELLAPLADGAPDVAAQAVYAARREWACTADDVLRRRTTVAYRGLATPETVARVESLLAAGSPGRLAGSPRVFPRRG